MRIHHVIFCALAVLGLSACGDDSGEMMQEQDSGDTPFEATPCPDDLPNMRIGMQAMGTSELIQAELTDADKIPIGWFHNDWSVKFTDADGEALDGITIDRAYTYMRVHRHGGGADPTSEEIGDGEFSFEGLNVTMSGPWEFIFEVTATNGDGEEISDEIVFNVCNSEPKPETR
jgi:hypothetical protein